MHAPVGLAVDLSQLLQPDVCGGQHLDQGEAGPGAAATGPSSQTSQTTMNGDCGEQQGTEKGSTRWVVQQPAFLGSPGSYRLLCLILFMLFVAPQMGPVSSSFITSADLGLLSLHQTYH